MVDLDEVMVSTNLILLPEFNRITGKQYTIDDWTDYDICSLYGITAADYYKAFDDVEAALHAQPKQNSLSGIQMLISNGITPVFITARRTTGLDPKRTAEWLTRYGVSTDNLHIIGSQCKGEYMLSLSNMYHFVGAVDDCLYNIAGIRKHMPSVPLFLMDCPHNRETTELADEYIRVSCMVEVARILEGTL